MSGISTTKKRKANDSRVTASDDDTHDVQIGDEGCDDHQSPSAQTCYGNFSQQIDTMMQIMLRMEEKCNRLEAKCDSLENIVKHVDSKVDSLDAKIDKKFKQHGYHSLLAMNHSWKYSAPVYSEREWMEKLEECYDHDEAEYLSETSEKLREATEKMRRGEFPTCDVRVRGINVDLDEDTPIFDHNINNYLLPHWSEFAAALKQFTPAFDVLPHDLGTHLNFYNVQLNHDAMLLMKDALMNKPFRELTFMTDGNRAGNTHRRGMSINAIEDIVNSNKHLRKLDLENNVIYRYDIEGICSSVHNHPSLVHLDLRNCFDNGLHDGDGLGDEMLTSLLTNGTLKLEKLVMSDNGITSNVTTLLSDFLATDPPLRELDLSDNRLLMDDDATLIANALRSNTTLRHLDLAYGSITDAGGESFRLVLNDDSTLNSVSDSNHSCKICLDGINNPWKMHRVFESINDLSKERGENRGRKIYRLLSSRNKSISNVQHFGDIDVKILPEIVRAVQKYAKFQVETDGDFVRELSIVYELMRKWEKVFPLYCDPK
jgi:hypothetical protein